MRSLKGLSIALAMAAAATAQNCNVAPATRTFSNRADFIASFYYVMGNHLFDLTAQVPLSISQINTWTYDSGIGNPPVPNQVGNQAVVDVYTCLTTRLGNETLNPATPGSPWTLLGSGTITIVATPGESAIVFNPPLAFPAGSYGVALNYQQPTSGTNPGQLHCLGKNPNPTPNAVSDQFLTFSNDGIQATAWTGIGTDSPNLRFTYTPDPTAAHYTTLGAGCYFRPQAFFENFPNGLAVPDLANTTQTWINLGPNYAVVPGGTPFVTPTSPSITTAAPGASSSGNWDDAISAPITLPFTFPYPGGSTSSITISSNGSVFLDAVTNGAYAVTGASYGSVSSFRDGPARISAYYHDLDPVGGTGSGTIHYDVQPGSQAVTITWNNVIEWGVPAAVNSMQITLDSAGNVNIAYGSLGNQSASNDAYFGFTRGNGATLPPAIDLSASLPYTSGDGSIPPILGMDARPVLGTTPNIITSNITPGTILQVLAAGDTLLPGPVDLGFIGMPGCLLQMNAIILLSGVIDIPTNTFIQPLSIPNNPLLQNAQLVFQAAPLTGGLNSLGLLLSNGICTRIGL